MGRKLNPSDIDGQACERVLTTLDIRQREKERLSKIEGELAEAASKRSLLIKEINEKNCSLCSSSFNFLFNKKVRCQECRCSVCRNCSAWDSKENLWLCIVCERTRSLNAHSSELIHNHLNTKFKNYSVSQIQHSIFKKDVKEAIGEKIQEDPTAVIEVWIHVETLLEGLLGETLDNTTLAPHSHQESLMNYQHELSTAILNLAKALYLSLQNSLLTDNNLCPTSTHAHLKSVLLDLQNAISELPPSEEDVGSSAAGQIESSPITSANSNEDLTYEGVLTCAVFNKLFEKNQRNHNEENRPDRLGGGEGDMLKKKNDNHSLNSAREYPDIVAHLDNNGNESDSTVNTYNRDRESSLGSESATEEFSWMKDNQTSLPPVEYVIEEQVEEITTTEAYSDSDDDVSRRSTRFSARHSSASSSDVEVKSCTDIIPGLHYYEMPDAAEVLRVTFPELGLDLIETSMLDEFDDSLSGLEDDIGVRFMDVMSWEDNWLFKRKRILPAFVSSIIRRTGFYDEPICMLIPNPNEFINPLIGTREIDEISELSERNSVGSLELESESESEKEALLLEPEPLEKQQQRLLHLQEVSLNISSSTKSREHHRLSNINKNNSNINKSNNTNAVQQSAPIVSEKPDVVPDPTMPQGLQVPKFIPPSSRQNVGVTRDPRFTIQPEDLTVHAGKVARFACEVIGSKPIGVVWFKGNKQIENSNKYQASLLRQKYVLEIYDTTKEDAGSYSCVAYNNKGQQWADFKITVKASSRAFNAPEFVVPLRVVQNNGNEPIRLSCTVSGYPEPKVYIYHNQQPLTNRDQYIIESTGYGEVVVEILSPTPKNAGQYYAIASNKLGDASSSCVLNLGGQGPQTNDANTEQTEVKSSVSKQKQLTSKSKPMLIQRTWSERQAELQKALADAFNEKAAFSSSPESTLTVRDEPDGSSPNEEEITEAINWNPVALNVPPRPGTIAEREHKKWQNAVPWPNNPYSPENIARRKNKPGSEIILVDQPISFEEFQKQAEEEEKKKQQISLLASEAKLKELARYKRDYYINYATSDEEQGDKKRQDLKSVHEDKGVDEALNSLEEKVYVSASKTLASDHRLKRAGTDGDDNVSNQESSPITDSDREMSVVELEVVRIKPEPLSPSPNPPKAAVASSRLLSSATRETASEDELSLPSVRDLVSKFATQSGSDENIAIIKPEKAATNGKEVVVIEKSGPDSQKLPPPQPMPRSSIKVATDVLSKLRASELQPDVVLDLSCSPNDASTGNSGIPVRMLTKQFDGDEAYTDQSGVSVKRVHSLTARSLSKEFRENALRNLPRPMSRPLPVSQESRDVSLTSGESSLTFSHESREGSPSLPLSPFASSAFTEGYTSDESTTSNNSLPRNKNRKRISRSVLQRASYWEKRAEQGLLSDTSVNEDFPPMESVPK